MISRATFSRSWRFFRSAKGSFALTVGALACGVALVAAIELVEKAVFRAFAETIDTAAGRAALQVTMEGEGLFPEEMKSLVDRVPGVEFSVAVLTGTAVTVDGPPELLTLHAFDILDEKALRVYGAGEGRVLEDALEFLNTAEAIIVTRAFAERRGLEHDQEIRLDTPTGRHAFRIGGIWEAAGIARAYGGNLIVQDILQAQEMFGRPGMIDRIDVVVDRGADPEEVAERLRKVLPSGLVVETPEQRKANLHAALRSMHLILRAVGLLALAAAFLIAFHRVGAGAGRRRSLT
ncbi:MAG: hypothetical protein KatS3mg076_0028 [Candidatus Binatia bacterium]|nr:MAG: hypothetical protein KatS3mg076_0028 [Candidatus Binatia bacterium]